MYNEAKSNAKFPETPAFIKRIIELKKDNYRPFERNMFDQISLSIENYLSPFLCCFRKSFSTQYCLTVILIDKGKIGGALLTDLRHLIAITTNY